MNKDKQEKVVQYKPHDKTISPFSDFITNSTNEEKEEVLTEVVKLANEDIEKMIKNRPWRERLGGLDFNPAYKKQIIKLIEKTLQEQRGEVRRAEKDRVIRIVTEYFEKGLGFNKGSMNDSVFEGLKDTLLKELKK